MTAPSDHRLDAALNYAALGLAVLPLHTPRDNGCSCGKKTCSSVGKHPRTMHGFKDAATDEAKIRKWWSRWPDANVGIRTGAESRLVVLDVDPKSGGNESLARLVHLHGGLPQSVEVETGGGGRHIYFRHPGKPVANGVGRLGSGLDVRGDGGFVVAPPSLHASGDRYRWKVDAGPDDLEVAAMPRCLRDLASTSEPRPDDNGSDSVEDAIPEGRRNKTLASLAGSMRQRGMTREAIEAALTAENKKKCRPPLGKAEVKGIAASISRYPPSEVTAVPQKAQLVALTAPLELFTDQRGIAYARINGDDHWETWPLRNSKFRSWLAFAFFTKKGVVSGNSVLNDAMNVIVGRALFEGENRVLHNRFAWHENALWYDLADENWRAVRIDASGWEIVWNPPPLFRRYSHQQAQVEPERGGSLDLLGPFLNISNRDDLILVQIWLVAALLEHVPRAILVPWGPQGSAKTFLTKLMRALIDPSSVPMPRFPHSDAEMAQTLDHHAAPFFDNLSSLNRQLSDTICRAVTGDGFSKRKLYTDDDDVLYSFRRVFVLNGINVPAMWPDLLDRSILVRLDHIGEEDRREENELWAEFQRVRPSIVGAMFDALSAAIRLHPSIHLQALPRMADWARWGFALAEAVGLGGDSFLKAYRNNRQAQNEEALGSHPVGAVVQAFMRSRREWKGSPSELFDRLTQVAEDERIDTKQRSWPGSAGWLTRRLNEVETNLLEVGIRYECQRGNDRRIRLSRIERPENTDGGDGSDGSRAKTGASPDATDDTDGIPRCSSLMPRITAPR